MNTKIVDSPKKRSNVGWAVPTIGSRYFRKRFVSIWFSIEAITKGSAKSALYYLVRI